MQAKKMHASEPATLKAMTTAQIIMIGDRTATRMII